MAAGSHEPRQHSEPPAWRTQPRELLSAALMWRIEGLREGFPAGDAPDLRNNQAEHGKIGTPRSESHLPMLAAVLEGAGGDTGLWKRVRPFKERFRPLCCVSQPLGLSPFKGTLKSLWNIRIHLVCASSLQAPSMLRSTNPCLMQGNLCAQLEVFRAGTQFPAETAPTLTPAVTHGRWPHGQCQAANSP